MKNDADGYCAGEFARSAGGRGRRSGAAVLLILHGLKIIVAIAPLLSCPIVQSALLMRARDSARLGLDWESRGKILLVNIAERAILSAPNSVLKKLD